MVNCVAERYDSALLSLLKLGWRYGCFQGFSTVPVNFPGSSM